MPDTLADITSGLLARGFSVDQATGITAGIFAESGGNPLAYNPSSGAVGIGQWLGARKTNLINAFGTSPTLDNQLDYLTSELKGGDAGGKAVLSAQGQGNILSAYVTKFMRPAAGAETTGDLSRGTNYLANANANGRSALVKYLGGTVGNGIADSLYGVGTALAAPGNAIDAGVTKLVGGLDPSQWFQRIALAILAILLIGIALSMLAGKPALNIVSKLPPVPV